MGLPQGSVLGPLLFSLHIKDRLPLYKLIKLQMYADDTVEYTHAKKIPPACKANNC